MEIIKKRTVSLFSNFSKYSGMNNTQKMSKIHTFGIIGQLKKGKHHHINNKETAKNGSMALSAL
jgi:hypothetical protein